MDSRKLELELQALDDKFMIITNQGEITLAEGKNHLEKILSRQAGNIKRISRYCCLNRKKAINDMIEYPLAWLI